MSDYRMKSELMRLSDQAGRGPVPVSLELFFVLQRAAELSERSGGAFDALVDFDAVVRDPKNPKQIRAEFNISDHLHPNDAGYKAMGEAIDLAIFPGRR